MDSSLRDRRLINEWKILEELGRTNQQIVEVLDHRSVADSDSFHIVLHNTSGMVRREGQRTILHSHPVAFRFARFFPALPIEAKLALPLFHPNVDSETGFVCLWNRFSAGDTIVEAIIQLQQIICWKQMNLQEEHVLQPEAVRWYNQAGHADTLPLDFRPVIQPEESRLEQTYRPVHCKRRRRLS